MDFPKYDGNIHPDEWINDAKAQFNTNWYVRSCITIKSYIDLAIKLPADINNYEELRKALKEDISFTVFKNTNKRKLQLLKYVPEREGGDTSKFISTFRKLCYNAEINDVEEQKKYLYNSLLDNHFISNEFYKKMKNLKSINELLEEFENVILEESSLIRSESIVVLKHVATGKYLSSIENLCYTTGSGYQLVYV
jgi:hypothetical protein